MNRDNSVFGHDRPERGSVLHVLLDGVPFTTVAGTSSETELVADVPRTRAGRHLRATLGTELVVSWGWRGTVRTRTYRLADVVTAGLGRHHWHLVPVVPAAEGTRRAVPRAEFAAPAVLAVGEGRHVGETVDISVAGVRLTFPVVAGVDPPEPGQSGELALLLDGERTAVEVSVVRVTEQPPGSVDVRVFLTGGMDEHRARLRDVVLTALDLAVEPAGAQANDEPVSAS